MGKKMFDKGSCLALVFMAMAILQPNKTIYAQRYACLGKCYNECVLRRNGTDPITGPERFGCYYQCLNGCAPRTSSDFQNYCRIGCSLRLCSQDSSDGEKLESCLDQCTDSCKR